MEKPKKGRRLPSLEELMHDVELSGPSHSLGRREFPPESLAAHAIVRGYRILSQEKKLKNDPLFSNLAAEEYYGPRQYAD